METLPADFIQYVKDIQRHIGHEPHAFRAARLLKTRVIIGASNHVLTDTEPATIVVLPWNYGRNNDVMRHELAHVLLACSNIESVLIKEYGSRVAARAHIELLCNQAVAFLQITQPVVDEAVRRHGVTAQAVKFIQAATRADPATALRRLVHDDPYAARAGFLTVGKHIGEVAVCNYSLPFWVFDRVPEPALKFAPGDVTLLALTKTRLIGICAD